MIVLDGHSKPRLFVECAADGAAEQGLSSRVDRLFLAESASICRQIDKPRL
jgi:hypothetical protein